MIQRTTSSYEETIKVAASMAQYVQQGDIFCLYGDLGAGKTTWVRGLVQGLTLKDVRVSSPTFVLMNIYDGEIPVYHFDLYRIDVDELINIGYEEFFYGDGVAIIEWSERLGELLPQDYFKIEISHVDEDKRALTIDAQGERCQKRLKEWVI